MDCVNLWSCLCPSYKGLVTLTDSCLTLFSVEAEYPQSYGCIRPLGLTHYTFLETNEHPASRMSTTYHY